MRALVRGAWAERWSLLLAAVVVGVATLLASAVPVAIGRTADDAVRDAVTRAGTDATVVVNAPFEEEDPSQRLRVSRTAAILDQDASLARFQLGPALAAAFRPPVPALRSTLLQVTGGGPGRTFRLAYVGGARVAWVAGGPPAAAVPAAAAGDVVPPDSGPWPVQVALSQPVAAALGVGPGDRVPVRDPRGQALDVRVSGVFRPLDAADPGWGTAPLLAGGATTAGLLSADSVPDARLALNPDEVTPTVTFTPEPSRLRSRDAEPFAAAIVALKASSGTEEASFFRWQSGLDGVLRDAQARIVAATAQADVLLVGLVVSAALMLLLAADLLVRRRTPVLATLRERGASLPQLGAGLVGESAVVALVGAAAGRAAGLWTVPVLVVAVLATPGFGLWAAARATPARRVPANRTARRSAARTRQLRRAAGELAVVLLAVGAFAALVQRGAQGVLPAAAPTLGAVVGALVVLRLLPAGVAFGLARALRSPRSLPVLGAARAAATSTRALPLLVLVVPTALLAVALAVRGTEGDRPLEEGLRRLASVSAVVLLVLAALGVVLAAATTAPARAVTLARLRTLGLRPRDARLVAAGELLPPVLAGAIAGTALGVLLAHLAVARVVGHAVTVPWTAALPIPLLALTATLVVATESRGRLAQTLRAGTA
ncbi:MAG TPA: FtsX-like permease family protein [Mycobacteriales bacterium]|nr:FtsX-like permease family protein [Mycobacteriales bacterium]